MRTAEDVFANGVFVREQLTGERFAEDGHESRSIAVLWGERAAAQDGDSQGGEVSGCDIAPTHHAAGWRERIRNGEGVHAGGGGQPPLQIIE